MALKKASKKQMDMLHGPMLKNLLLFALPLAASGIIQQLFTSADMAVVYYFEGTTAQAAVNSNGALVNLIINLFTGMSVGATVIIGELIGKKLESETHNVVFTALAVAAVGGVVLLGLGMGIAAPLLSLMDLPAEVYPLAVQYLRIYFAGMPFLMVYDFGAAILRAIGDTVRPLIVLFASGVLNVGLNLLFVGACGMSVAGVAIATVFANLLCAVLVVTFIMENDMLRIRRKSSKFKFEHFKRIVFIGLPAGLQGAVFSLANVFIQTSINGFGDAAMAGSGDAVNFEMYVYCFTGGFANATVSFCSQNHAAGEYARCKKAVRLNMAAAVIVSAALSVIFTAGGRLFIRIYTSDPAAIEYALVRMKCVLLTATLACLYEIPGGALRGLGHSFTPALLTVIGSCVLRLIWIYTVFAARPEFWLLMIIYPITWIATGIAMIIAYFVMSRKDFKAVDKSATVTGEIPLAEAAAAADDRAPECDADTDSAAGEQDGVLS